VLLVTYKLIKYFISSNTTDYNISTFSYLHLASASFPQFGTFSTIKQKTETFKNKRKQRLHCFGREVEGGGPCSCAKIGCKKL